MIPTPEEKERRRNLMLQGEPTTWTWTLTHLLQHGRSLKYLLARPTELRTRVSRLLAIQIPMLCRLLCRLNVFNKDIDVCNPILLCRIQPCNSKDRNHPSFPPFLSSLRRSSQFKILAYRFQLPPSNYSSHLSHLFRKPLIRYSFLHLHPVRSTYPHPRQRLQSQREQPPLLLRRRIRPTCLRLQRQLQL
jgi:hypothetical protein